MTGIQISMCVQLSGLEILLYDCLDEVYMVKEVEFTLCLDLLVSKVDIILLCSFI